MRRTLTFFTAIGLASLAGVAAAPSLPASADASWHARVGHFLGLIPPIDTSSGAGITNSAPATGSLHYNGGPVMTTNKVYTIYWQPSGYQFPTGYADNVNQYFKDLQATNGKNTNTYDNATQYYQKVGSKKQYVQDHTTFSGTVLDTSALPQLDPVNCPDTPAAAKNGGSNPPSTNASCVTDAQVQQEISAVVKRQGWPVSNNTEFFMYTAPNIGTCIPAGVSAGGTGTSAPLCSFSYFCAYHSSFFDSTVTANAQIIYSNMAYAAQTAGSPLTCDTGSYPNGNPSDPEIKRHQPRAHRDHHGSVRDWLVGQQLQRQRVRHGDRRHVRMGLREPLRPGGRPVQPDHQPPPLPHADRVGQQHERLSRVGRLG